MNITTLHLVRSSSSRLPSKALMKIGDLTLIEHSIQRSLKFKMKPIICTSINSDDDVFEKIALQNKVAIFRGSLNNKLKRIIDCSNFYKLEFIHVIDVDDPYFDPIQIRKSISLLKNKKFGIIMPSVKSSKGLASVGYSYNINFLNSNIDSKEADNVEMLDNFFLNKKFKKKISKAENITYFNINARLTIDYIEDLKFFNCLNSIVGNFATRKKIEKVLFNNKDISKINYFRNNEWSKRQKKIKNYETKI